MIQCLNDIQPLLILNAKIYFSNEYGRESNYYFLLLLLMTAQRKFLRIPKCQFDQISFDQNVQPGFQLRCCCHWCCCCCCGCCAVAVVVGGVKATTTKQATPVTVNGSQVSNGLNQNRILWSYSLGFASSRFRQPGPFQNRLLTNGFA